MPTLCVPSDKRDRAIAMIDYMAGRRPGVVSRLALSVMTGLLQSLVDASPSRMGQTFLHQAYDVMHTTDDNGTSTLHPHHRLYSCTKISDAAWDDLLWWRAALLSGVSRPARYPGSGTLVTTWGDGSGTGAGGTIHTTEAHKATGTGGSLPDDEPTFRVGEASMWMGQWRPRIHKFSSNFKEMRTLLTAMELLDRDPVLLHG